MIAYISIFIQREAEIYGINRAILVLLTYLLVRNKIKH